MSGNQIGSNQTLPQRLTQATPHRCRPCNSRVSDRHNSNTSAARNPPTAPANARPLMTATLDRITFLLLRMIDALQFRKTLRACLPVRTYALGQRASQQTRAAVNQARRGEPAGKMRNADRKSVV